MGRYYSGDIEGKFWFGVQSSNAADRFGVTGHHPYYLEYYYEQEDLPHVKQEIAKIENNLAEKKILLDEFFNDEQRISYSDKDMVAMGISPQDLSEYADLLLGYKIAKSIEKNGSCEFQAEL